MPCITPYFNYNLYIPAKISGIILTDREFSLSLYQHPDDVFDPLYKILRWCAKNREALNSALSSLPVGNAKCEILFYTLMMHRHLHPAFFPVHDIALAIANICSYRWPVNELPNFQILDWEMLPAAILLASRLKKGASVYLPKRARIHNDMRIAHALQNILPDIDWKVAIYRENDIPDNTLVLGCNVARHSHMDRFFLDRLKKASGGIFYTAWDFLGVRSNSFTRSRWVNEKIIENVLQLPKPRRQRASCYPAIIGISPPAEPSSARLAHIPKCNPGPGTLEQRECLSLLFSAPVKGRSLDVDIAELARDGHYNLTPAKWLHGEPEYRGGTTLRAFAQVLRCQIPRERLTADEARELMDAYAPGSGNSSNDGQNCLLAKEITLDDLDPVTGFVRCMPNRGFVKMGISSLGSQGKYILQQNDIVFAFRGTASSVGQVGILQEELEDWDEPGGHPCQATYGSPALVTGQSLCIIRALPDIDPVWLYYYLQTPEVAAFARSHASGTNLLTVNLETIRDIPIQLPEAREVAAINHEHAKIVDAMLKISTLWKKAVSAKVQIEKKWKSPAQSLERTATYAPDKGKFFS